MILKAGREYQLTKEPLLRTTTRGVNGMLVVSRYLLIAPDDKVLKVDKMHWAEDGRFDIKLPAGPAAGRVLGHPRHLSGRQCPATLGQGCALSPRRDGRARGASVTNESQQCMLPETDMTTRRR